MALEFAQLLRPKMLGAALVDALNTQDTEVSIDRVEDLLKEQRSPDLLVAYAVVLFEDTVCIMVDEVATRFPQILELLKEAVSLGYPAAALKRFRARVRRLLKRDADNRAAVLALLDEDPATLDLRSVTRLAFALAEKPASAARGGELYRLAWQRYQAEGAAAHRVDDNRGRAALAFAKAGRWADALPELRWLVSEETKAVDSWQIQFAWCALLEHARKTGDDATLRADFDAARAWAKSNADVFPVPRPFQDKVLRWFVEADDDVRLRQVVEVMIPRRTRKNTDESTWRLLQEARARYSVE